MHTKANSVFTLMILQSMRDHVMALTNRFEYLRGITENNRLDVIEYIVDFKIDTKLATPSSCIW